MGNVNLKNAFRQIRFQFSLRKKQFEGKGSYRQKLAVPSVWKTIDGDSNELI